MGADLQRGHFLTKMHVKTKELDPVGGRGGSGYCNISVCFLVILQNRTLTGSLYFIDIFLYAAVGGSAFLLLMMLIATSITVVVCRK